MKQILLYNKNSVSYCDNTPEEIKVDINVKLYEFDDTPKIALSMHMLLKKKIKKH